MIFLADAEPIPGSASSSDSDAVLTSIRPPAVVPSFGCAVAFLPLVLWAAGFAGDVEELLVVVGAVLDFDFFEDEDEDEDEDEAAFSDDADFSLADALEDPTVTFDLIFEIVDAETPALLAE